MTYIRFQEYVEYDDYFTLTTTCDFPPMCVGDSKPRLNGATLSKLSSPPLYGSAQPCNVFS